MSFWLHGCCGKWEGWARKPVNHTRWPYLLQLTVLSGPQPLWNRTFYCDVVCVVTLPFDISAGVRAFVIGLSQISSFFLIVLVSGVDSENYHREQKGYGTVFEVEISFYSFVPGCLYIFEISILCPNTLESVEVWGHYPRKIWVQMVTFRIKIHHLTPGKGEIVA